MTKDSSGSSTLNTMFNGNNYSINMSNNAPNAGNVCTKRKRRLKHCTERKRIMKRFSKRLHIAPKPARCTKDMRRSEEKFSQSCTDHRGKQ